MAESLQPKYLTNIVSGFGLAKPKYVTTVVLVPTKPRCRDDEATLDNWNNFRLIESLIHKLRLNEKMADITFISNPSYTLKGNLMVEIFVSSNMELSSFTSVSRTPLRVCKLNSTLCSCGFKTEGSKPRICKQ